MTVQEAKQLAIGARIRVPWYGQGGRVMVLTSKMWGKLHLQHEGGGCLIPFSNSEALGPLEVQESELWD